MKENRSKPLISTIAFLILVCLFFSPSQAEASFDTVYVYDDLNRLIAENHPAYSRIYIYDEVGNIVNKYTLRDMDADGLEYPNDNCVDVYNPGQQDSDNDGHGNACDCDFVDPDGSCDFWDVATWGWCYVRDARGLDTLGLGIEYLFCTNIGVDMNSDGVFNEDDEEMLLALFPRNADGTYDYATGNTPTPWGYIVTDQDLDGIENRHDNCQRTHSSIVMDSDSDGYGNICDCDFNNDGICNKVDAYILYLFALYYQNTGTMHPNADTWGVDMNGDGIMNEASYFYSMFPGHEDGAPITMGEWQTIIAYPGPSALDCAGTVPCM